MKRAAAMLCLLAALIFAAPAVLALSPAESTARPSLGRWTIVGLGDSVVSGTNCDCRLSLSATGRR